MMKRSLNRPYSSGRDVVMDVSRGGTGARTSSELVSKLGLIKTTDLGRPGGVAVLDREGKIPAEYIPENITIPETGPKIRIEGPEFLAAGESGTYVITNYDSYTEYEISTGNGVVSRDGDTITYKPSDVGTEGFGINNTFVKVTVTADPEALVTPSIVTPANGAVDVPNRVMFEVGDYTGTGTLDKTEYQVAMDPGFTQIRTSGSVTGTSGFVSFGVENSVVYMRARYVLVGGGVSAWGPVISFNTSEGSGWGYGVVKKLTGTERFGNSVAMNSDGSMVIVGTGTGGTYAEIYERNGSYYTLVKKLTGTGEFGYSVAMNADGSMVIVGPRDGNYAEIYERNGNDYILVTKLTGTGNFGFSVAMNADGSMVIVGSVSDGAKIYERNGSDYTLVKKLTGTSNFGSSVAMNSDGTMVIVGASGSTSTTGNYANIYERSGNNYTLVKKLTGAEEKWFGKSVAMNSDGSMVIVGTVYSNYTQIYERTGNDYTLVKKLTGTGDFGISVAMNPDGSMVIVGTYRGNYAEIYERNGNDYTLVKKLTGTGEFGSSVAMNSDGSMVIVGTSGDVSSSRPGNYADIAVRL